MTDSDCYLVLDEHDVISFVSPALERTMGTYVGHSLWVRMPGSEQLLRPHLDHARRTGEEVECVAFHAGATLLVRAVPSGERLTVYPTRMSRLDVRTLTTLRASLARMLAELSAQAPVRSDRRAPASLRALP